LQASNSKLVHDLGLFIWHERLLRVCGGRGKARRRGKSVYKVPHAWLQKGGFDGGQMQQQVAPRVRDTARRAPKREAVQRTKQALVLEGVEERRGVGEGF
jgi:hypothetical protein